MTSEASARTRALLADSLTVWKVRGDVMPGEPPADAVIHGVQHVFHPLVWLERWPSDDRRTRIVFIVQGIPPSWVRGLLELLDAEVADETARQEASANDLLSGLHAVLHTQSERQL